MKDCQKVPRRHGSLDLRRKELGSERKATEAEMQSVHDRYFGQMFYSPRGYLYRILRGLGLSFFAEKIIPLQTTQNAYLGVREKIEELEKQINSIRFPPAFAVGDKGNGSIPGNIVRGADVMTPVVTHKKEELPISVAAEIPPGENGDLGDWKSRFEVGIGGKIMELVTSEESGHKEQERSMYPIALLQKDVNVGRNTIRVLTEDELTKYITRKARSISIKSSKDFERDISKIIEYIRKNPQSKGIQRFSYNNQITVSTRKITTYSFNPTKAGTAEFNFANNQSWTLRSIYGVFDIEEGQKLIVLEGIYEHRDYVRLFGKKKPTSEN